MKLVHIELDGFGVWSGLALRNLSPDCTVLYGLNEAGKTTLLEFIRGMLYGFTPQRAARYLPPVHGGTPGGRLSIFEADEGQLRICRRPIGNEPLGTVAVEAADGKIQGEAHLERLLHDVDEATFENVFAVGLRELQELGTLNDLEAARWLYELTAGLDRVSIIEVVRELEQSSSRILGDAQNVLPISQLATRRDQLREQIGRLADSSRRYSQLLDDRDTCQTKVARLEEAISNHEAGCRLLEAAALACDAWHRRAVLNAQIDASGAGNAWTTDAIARMDRLCRRIRRLKTNSRRMVVKRRRRRTELSHIKLHDAIWRQSARIAALVENESWVASLEQAIQQAEANVNQLTAQSRECGETLGDRNAPSAKTPFIGFSSNTSETIWKRLRSPAAALARSRKRLTAARRRAEQNRAAAGQAHGEVRQALSMRKQADLTSAIEAAGKQVTQLRNRIHADDRLNQLAQSKTDLEQQILDLSERQILPPWILAAVGGVFVLSAVLILASLLLPTSFIGSIGWPMTWLGIVGIGSAVAAKFTMERSMSRQLDATRKQHELVKSQTDSASRQRDELDAALPKDARPLNTRLEAAQRELAELEKLLPLDAQRQTAQREADRYEAKLTEARQKHAGALSHWGEALSAAGIPESLNPRQVRERLSALGRLKVLQRQLADAQSDLDRRRQELAALAAHVAQVFEASQIEPASSQLTGQLRQLRRDLAAQETLQKQRESLRRRLGTLRRRQRSVLNRLRVSRRRRKRLLGHCSATSVADFRRRAAEFSRIADIVRERDALSRDIDSVIRGLTPEATLASIVSGKTTRQIEQELSAKRQYCQEIRAEHRALLEQGVQLSEQVRQLAADRRLAAKRFELSQVEAELAGLIHDGLVLTITSHVLQRVKQAYERDRQPETLREASEYLSQLTAGRYVRVWTRLGQNVLLVDDADGHSLPIEVLSHGTREQLFLSLRLALVGLFARRGAKLPLVLDDVLVNFDAARAKAAIEVLHDFSRHGHQILMLTCHEHIAGLCRSHEMDVRRLPDHRQGNREHPFEAITETGFKKHRTRRQKDHVLRTEVIPEASLAPTPTETIALVSLPSEPTLRTLSPHRDHAELSPRTPQLVSHFRVDLPQSSVRPPAIMRRWGAEEFSGELDDRVNPLWLLSSNQTTIGSQTIIGSPHGASDDSAAPVINPSLRLRLFSERSPILVEPIQGDDDWEL